jgi:mono/diheme cytochrome c family protein
MRLTLFPILAAALFATAQAPAFGQEAQGDAEAGRKLAETWCAACHHIESQGAGAGAVAPSFADVAKLPSTTALALKVFLRTSHATMPNLQLTRQETDDVIAYILSLKEP